MAEGMGLTVNETRRILSGKTSIDEVLKGKTTKDPRQKALTEMAKAGDMVSGSFKDMVPHLKRFQGAINRMVREINAQVRRKSVAIGGDMGSKLLKQIGLGDASAAEFMEMLEKQGALRGAPPEEIMDFISQLALGGKDSFRTAKFQGMNLNDLINRTTKEMAPEEKKFRSKLIEDAKSAIAVMSVDEAARKALVLSLAKGLFGKGGAIATLRSQVYSDRPRPTPANISPGGTPGNPTPSTGGYSGESSGLPGVLRKLVQEISKKLEFKQEVTIRDASGKTHIVTVEQKLNDSFRKTN